MMTSNTIIDESRLRSGFDWVVRRLRNPRLGGPRAGISRGWCLKLKI